MVSGSNFVSYFNFIFSAEARSYRKIPKICPSKYKPPKPVTQISSIKSPL